MWKNDIIINKGKSYAKKSLVLYETTVTMFHKELYILLIQFLT